MKGKYYKPTGDAMTAVIDWLIGRKTVRQTWDKFLADNAMQETDLVIEEGQVIEANYYPPFVDDIAALDRSIHKLPTMPTYEALGALLGVEKAKGIQVVGSGTIVLVMGSKKLKGHRPINAEVLEKRYNIHVHTKDCPECGLWLSNDEVVCHRCGYKQKKEED